MEPRSLPKDSAFLSRPKPGEDFATYKNRMLDTFEAKGWLSPEDGEEPQPHREGQTEDLTYKEDSDSPLPTGQTQRDLSELPPQPQVPENWKAPEPKEPSEELQRLYSDLM